MKRRALLVAALAVILAAAFAGTASAEQCSPDGKICLLTEATAAAPYQPPQAIQVAVDSAADTVTFTGYPVINGMAERVAGGPPDGMSVWQFASSVLTYEGTIALEVCARVYTPPSSPCSFTATFPNLSVRATALFGDSRIQRVGKGYVATFDYTARQPLTIEQGLALTTRDPHKSQVTTQTTETGLGAGTATMRVDAETVKEFCRKRLRCYLGLGSTVYLGGQWFGQEQLVGSTIKTPRLRCLKRVEALLARSKRTKRNPKLKRRLRRQARKLHPRCYDWSVQEEPPIAGAPPPDGRPPLIEPSRRTPTTSPR